MNVACKDKLNSKQMQLLFHSFIDVHKLDDCGSEHKSVVVGASVGLKLKLAGTSTAWDLLVQLVAFANGPGYPVGPNSLHG